MPDLLRRNAMFILFVLLCSASSLSLIHEVSGWGNELSSVDPGSEANALREVRHFLEEGVTRYYGLGNISYPGMYPESGTVPWYFDGPAIDPAERDYIRQHVLTSDGVYTHYPPGSEYLLYAEAKVLGLEPVWRLRLLPIAIGYAAITFLGLSIRRRFGSAVGWLVASAMVLTPSVTSAFVGLHDQGYALALTMCEIGIALGGGSRLLPFAGLGFLQGWLTFDQVFLVTFIPLAIELVMPAVDPGYRPRWNLALVRTALAGCGFAVAHTLHFLEVWAYIGSFEGAVRDLAGAAAYRSGLDTDHGLIGYVTHAAHNLQIYFVGGPVFDAEAILPGPAFDGRWPMFRFAGIALGPWWVLITVGLIVWGKLQPASNAEILRGRWHYVFAIGFVMSSLWLLVMIDHSGYHERFIYRHLFFLYFVCILFGACAVCRQHAAGSMPRIVVGLEPVRMRLSAGLRMTARSRG